MSTLYQFLSLIGLFLGWAAMLWARYRAQNNDATGNTERALNILGAGLTFISTWCFLEVADPQDAGPLLTALGVLLVTLYAAVKNQRVIEGYIEAEAIIAREDRG